jgi:hypothetical protein
MNSLSISSPMPMICLGLPVIMPAITTSWKSSVKLRDWEFIAWNNMVPHLGLPSHFHQLSRKVDMPYIKKEDRPKFNSVIEDVVDELTEHGYATFKVGELNYVLSSIIWKLFDQSPSYSHGNDLVGVIECVKEEFYRRKLSKLEDEKILENGDI